MVSLFGVGAPLPLAMALFRGSIAGARDRNVLLAPGGVVAALSLLAAGARGETLRQLQAVIGMPQAIPAPPSGIVAGSPVQTATLRHGNCLWLPRHLHPSESLQAALLRQDGAAAVISCAAEDAPAQINAWCVEATDNLILTLIADPPDPSGFMIANAISFSDAWLWPFDPTLTASGTFHQGDGTTVTAPFMRRYGWFYYARVAGGQLVDLPYTEGGSLMICLPDRADSMNAWLDNPRASVFDLQVHVGTLRLPRLDLSFEIDLRALLSQFEVTDSFAPEHADFSGLTAEGAPLFATDVRQKLVIGVDEIGTRAAAVTSVLLAGAALEPPPFEMTVDRPFFFAIRGEGFDRPILFLGAVERL